MRIVHAIHSYPPDSHGGVETYVQMLAHGQSARGDQVVVLAGSDRPAGDAGGAPTVGGIAVVRAPGTAPDVAQLAADDRQDAWLTQCLRDLAPELLHLHHWHNLSPNVVGIARELGIAVVVTLHDYFATCPLFFRLPDHATPCAPDLPAIVCARCVQRFVPLAEAELERRIGQRQALFARQLTSAQLVLTLSPPQQDFLQRVPWLHGARLQTLLLPAPTVPVPRATWTPATDGSLRLVTWGGLVPGKGLHTVVQACERLPAADRITIDHFGRAFDEGHAAQLAAMALRVRLRLRGAYDERAMAEQFPAYDAMVFPSLFLETHGFAVDEALALGLPVLVTERGAPAARVGARGRVVAAGDVAAWATAIEALREKPDLLAAMRAATAPRQPSQDEHVRALAQLYAGALAR